MASELYSGSEAIGSGEHSFTTDSGSPDVATDAGFIQLVLGLSDMVSGDEFLVRMYAAVLAGDTPLLVESWPFVGPQSKPISITPGILLMHGWRMTGETIAGGTITVKWSIRKG